jgi:hypothetical protein
MRSLRVCQEHCLTLVLSDNQLVKVSVSEVFLVIADTTHVRTMIEESAINSSAL